MGLALAGCADDAEDSTEDEDGPVPEGGDGEDGDQTDDAGTDAADDGGDEGTETDLDDDIGTGEADADDTDDTDGEDEDDEDGADTGEDDAEEEEEPETEDWEDVDSISIDANEDGWNGRSPDVIEGETNPVLELYAGREYEITWLNNDGEEHQLQLLEDDDPVEETDPDDEQLEEHTLTFEASDDLTEYRCSVHTDVMVGQIEIHSE